MKKKWIFGIAVVALIIPFAINLLLLCPAYFPFVGNATNWLAFWGSYLGGGLAALVGFVTLYYSAKRQNIQLQISNKQKELSVLQDKLAEYVSAFNYSRLCSIVLYINDLSKYNGFISDMEQYNEELAANANAFGLLYAGNNNITQTASRFQDQYLCCYNVFNTNTTELSKQVSDLRDIVQKYNINPLSIEEDPRTKDILETIVLISNEQNSVSSNLKILFRLAQEWIKEEETEVDKLKQQLKL